MDCNEVFSLDECEAFFDKIDEDLDFDKIDQDLDYAFALSLQEEVYNEEIPSKQLNQKTSKNCPSTSAQKPLGIIDKQWELLDPNPDIHALFIQYNAMFFYGKLHAVEVKWSPRMTLCAGVCSYEGRGGLCSVRLSLPLLKLRPRRDLVETLLHEMIHAYLFVTANNKDHDAHGPEFCKHMHRINKETGTKISIYHSFHDEVDLYRKHVWKCNGPCRNRRPFYGLVKRAMNRVPGPKDTWWSQHQSSCGGTFTKISEPEDYKNKGSKRKPLNDASNSQSSSIKKFIKSPHAEKGNNSTANKINGDKAKSILSKDDNLVHVLSDTSKPSTSKDNISLFSGKGFQLGSSSDTPPRSFLAKIRTELKSTSDNPQQKSFNSNSSLNELKSTFAKPQQKNFNSNSSFNAGIKKMLNSKDIKNSKLPQRNIQSHSPFNISSEKIKNSSNSGGLNASVPTNQHTGLFKSPNFVQSSIESFVNTPLRDSKKTKEVQPVQLNAGGSTRSKVNCPVCFKLFTELEINSHLDICLLTY